jgi:co-chaperonin GroES (HSP10)
MSIVDLTERAKKAAAAEVVKQSAASAMPVPAGYRLLCAVPEIEEKFEGSSLIKSDITKGYEELLTVVLFVIAVGPDAYKDEKRFPSGPWCKAGDFVLTRAHAGTRIKIFGKEMRLINDDAVEAVVADPRGIKRA